MLQALRLFGLSLGALAVLGCNVTSDGSAGDPPTDPDPDVLGSGARISEVMGPATWFKPEIQMGTDGCSFPPDRQVSFTGQIIVAVDRFDETNDGAIGNIYIQDLQGDPAAPVPYSGLTIFGASFTPPDLRIFEGDVVDTFGTLTEFIGPNSAGFGGCRTLPEASGAIQLRFDAAPAAPSTIVFAGADASRWAPIIGYDNARQWLGMLVRLEGVTIGTDAVADSAGRYTAALDLGGGLAGDDLVKISNELFDLEASGLELTAGTQYAAVTGVLTYFYGFKIAPRSAADFE